jgi:hypothetical protein
VSGLHYYRFGPGRCEAHTDPHLIAGWRPPAELEPPLRHDGHRDFRHLSGLLQQPHDALGERGFDRPVWHCSVRAAPGDRMLSDDEWAQFACAIMHRTGLAPYGQEDQAVRWVAVRHAADHIHLVAMLARQDGTRPRLWNDYYRIGEACRAAEHRLGLRGHRPPRPDRRAPADPGGVGESPPPRPGRTTPGHAAPHGRHRRSRLLQRARVLRPPRHRGHQRPQTVQHLQTRRDHRLRRRPPTDTTNAGGPVWYGGGKLAPDLTLPKLRHRWAPAGATDPTGVFTAAERSAVYEHAARAARDAAQQIRHHAATDPGAAADAAWAAADTLHAAASALGNPELRRAADAYDHAARCAHGRLPRPTLTGNSLRTAGRILSAAAIATGDPVLAQLRLILQLAALTEAVIDLRAAQRHAAQAAAARTAAERLYAARRCYTAPPASRARARTHGNQATRDFPLSIQQVLAEASAKAYPPYPAAASYPSPARRRLGSAVPPGNRSCRIHSQAKACA